MIQLRMFTLPWLPRKGLAKTGVRNEPSPKKRCIVYLRHKTRLITERKPIYIFWCILYLKSGGAKLFFSHIRRALPASPNLKKKDIAGGVEGPAEHAVDEGVDAHRRHRAVPWEDQRGDCVTKSAVKNVNKK